jgi:integrase
MLRRTANPRSDFLYRKGDYLYFRFPKRFKVKPFGLPTDETSRDFERQYDHCLAALRKLEADEAAILIKALPQAPRKSTFGSVGKAVELYLGGHTFKALKPKTQRIYRAICDRIKTEIGDGEIKHLDRDAVEDFSNAMFDENGKASMADLYVTVINNVWKEVRKDEQFAIRKLVNPTNEIERRHKERSKKPHLKWSDAVHDAFDDTAPDNLMLAKHVLHFTVQRGGDAIRIEWDHYDGRGVKIWPEKTTAKDAVLDPKYHLLPDVLIEMLDAAKKTATTKTILVNALGKPWASANVLSQAIRRHMVKVGIRQKGVRGPGMHGLRHTGGSDVAALPGVGIKGIMSVGGWKSERQAMRYAEQAEKEQINEATIAAWNAELDRKARLRAAARAKRRASLKVVK